MRALAAPPADAAAVLAAAAALDLVEVGAVDWDGRLRSKHIAATRLAGAVADGIALTSAIFAQGPQDIPDEFGPFADPAGGYADGRLVLDWRSARATPYAPGGRGLLLLGSFAPPLDAVCPRALLAAELARWDALGYAVRGAFELEFMLLDERAAGVAAKSAAELVFAPGFERMYSVVDQAVQGDLLRGVRNDAAAMGIAIDSMHHEFQGIAELALAPVEGLAIADEALLLRSLVAIAAARQGRLAAFMARLSPTRQSCGAHLNLSLRPRDGAGNALVVDDAGLPGPLATALLGGLCRRLPELFVLCAPNVNSYKRFAPDCLAPRVSAWGLDNKTVAYRVVAPVPAAARIEVRVGGADVNPHLLLAAVLAAARAGLTEALVPPPCCAGDAAAIAEPIRFPASLPAATAAWRDSVLARAAFGARFVEAYALGRDWQQHLFERTVTDWELQMYLRLA